MSPKPMIGQHDDCTRYHRRRCRRKLATAVASTLGIAFGRKAALPKLPRT